MAILFTILQEYPYHLLQLKDTTRLEEFLGDFKVFDKLYDRDYSPKLILYWKEVHMYQLFFSRNLIFDMAEMHITGHLHLKCFFDT